MWFSWFFLWVRATDISGLMGEGSVSILARVLVGRTQFLRGSKTEGLSSSRAVGWRPSLTTLVHHSHLLHCSERARKTWERPARWKSRSFITSELVSHRFCLHLLVRSESVGPTHPQGKGWHRARMPGRGPPARMLEGCLAWDYTEDTH